MLRAFTDSSGVEWRVWEVVPVTHNASVTTSDAFSHASLKDSAYANGWLCFESTAEKRRLAPIPSDWGDWGPQLLEDLCQQAQPVVARRTRTARAS